MMMPAQHFHLPHDVSAAIQNLFGALEKWREVLARPIPKTNRVNVIGGRERGGLTYAAARKKAAEPFEAAIAVCKEESEILRQTLVELRDALSGYPELDYESRIVQSLIQNLEYAISAKPDTALGNLRYTFCGRFYQEIRRHFSILPALYVNFAKARAMLSQDEPSEVLEAYLQAVERFIAGVRWPVHGESSVELIGLRLTVEFNAHLAGVTDPALHSRIQHICEQLENNVTRGPMGDREASYAWLRVTSPHWGLPALPLISRIPAAENKVIVDVLPPEDSKAILASVCLGKTPVVRVDVDEAPRGGG